MFSKLLVANRGEIACRIIRTAKQMGIRTVSIYSDADANSLHVELADEAVHIGGAAPADSYLQKQRIVEAALATGAEAIHPGYGFLSENAGFASLCEASGLVFIGPPATAIESMGSKSAAKNIMEAAGVPVLPGYHGDDQSPSVLEKAAEDLGYPVLLKAAAGGGGKGMRQVLAAGEFKEGLASARREAKSSFGDDRMLVEKLLLKPRHVEVQVFCDSHGNGVYLFERDCSVQRRHQKIIEEAPAPGMTNELRVQMGQAAVTAALAINYVGAGTVEFLLSTDGSFFFMEMNTRLQVEHPVTEMVTGQDLVEWQLRVADGQKLPCRQEDVKLRGHAFEARIYAEDPDKDFLPASGTLGFLQTPEINDFVRIDSGVRQGDDIGVFYDPMIAKLIAWGEDRDQARQRLSLALARYRIRGVTTNLGFLKTLCDHEAFSTGEVHTGFIEQHRSSLFEQGEVDLQAMLAIACAYLVVKQSEVKRALLMKNSPNESSTGRPGDPWAATDNWRPNGPCVHTRTLRVNGQEFTVSLEQTGPDGTFRPHDLPGALDIQASLNGDLFQVTANGHRRTLTVYDNGNEVSLFSDEGAFDVEVVHAITEADTDQSVDAGFVAPMNGTITEILVTTGDRVEAGKTLIIMEAMKMEHAMHAPGDGIVGEIFFGVGDLVKGGAVLLEFEGG